MKALHVASFRGNIGDNANHLGFRPWFESLVGRPVTWREFEIRNVYRKLTAFDDSFVAMANGCDLVVVGGGNYFELWVDQSPTGTSFSIEQATFEKLRVPVFFNALGVDEGQGASRQNLDKFGRFLGGLLGSSQYLVSVRNDGAYPVLQKHFRDLPLDKVLRLPDGGFFADFSRPASTRRAVQRGADRPRIGINLAGDMLALRFPGEGAHTYSGFLDEFASLVAEVAERWPRASLTFYPHIFSDLKVYADLLDRLPDVVRRERIEVASYGSGNEVASAVFADYAGCDLVLGMRFHANVVPIGQRVPTIGLCCYSQVENLYRELAMPQCCIDVSRTGFSQALRTQITMALENPGVFHAELSAINERLSDMRAVAGRRIGEWLGASAADPAQAVGRQ